MKISARTLRGELSLFLLGSISLLVLLYSVMLDRYYDRGIDDAIEATMRLEARTFSRAYQADPDAVLPASGIFAAAFSLQQLPPVAVQGFGQQKLQPSDIHEFEVRKGDGDSWNQTEIFVLLPHPLHDGRTLYLLGNYDLSLFSEAEVARADTGNRNTLIVAAAVLLIVLGLMRILRRRISRQADALADWAEQLNLETHDQTPPDFRYHELNRIALQLQQAFDRISQILRREHHFLRHASHELRTPIAVTRSSLELIRRKGIEPQLERPTQRIERANRNMQQLTETLLWLSRENEPAPHWSLLDLNAFTSELAEELSYLLSGKQVQWQLEATAQHPQSQPATPLRIVLANLIRNAFQYTHEGEILISVSDQQIRVHNRDQSDNSHHHEDSFGLGLSLAQQICERLGWALAIEPGEGGLTATLTLAKKAAA
ncbi:sensor histidine kinase [Marinobacterium jannaschii]|uniref:sensor histidine kinase n=1 Tax=Marinobacterium jannaschii TaxID=64970 RepID=UPI000486CABE|nr:HAMP domain-containing sensor histidine kinase [Marinobacterium jannaschii]